LLSDDDLDATDDPKGSPVNSTDSRGCCQHDSGNVAFGVFLKALVYATATNIDTLSCLKRLRKHRPSVPITIVSCEDDELFGPPSCGKRMYEELTGTAGPIRSDPGQSELVQLLSIPGTHNEFDYHQAFPPHLFT
jgi:hypothetical protein